MAGRLDGKVAIVTGGNSGIGEATSHLFAREGAKVALLARREAEGVKVQDAIRSDGGDATYIQCDVSDREMVDSAVAKAVETYGGVDVLFNNAGHGAPGNFPDEEDDAWDKRNPGQSKRYFLHVTRRMATPDQVRFGRDRQHVFDRRSDRIQQEHVRPQRAGSAVFVLLRCQGRHRRLHPLLRR